MVLGALIPAKLRPTSASRSNQSSAGGWIEMQGPHGRCQGPRIIRSDLPSGISDNLLDRTAATVNHRAILLPRL